MRQILIVISALSLDAARAFNQIYPLVNTVMDGTLTTPVVENTAFGSCTCDVTMNSCDIYCCCDTDCSQQILDYWRADYNNYCLRATFGSEYQPLRQCVDNTHIYGYNQRMGMEISTLNGQLCVELDTGSLFSNYN